MQFLQMLSNGEERKFESITITTCDEKDLKWRLWETIMMLMMEEQDDCELRAHTMTILSLAMEKG